MKRKQPSQVAPHATPEAIDAQAMVSLIVEANGLTMALARLTGQIAELASRKGVEWVRNS
jgi:hypothetical protein